MRPSCHCQRPIGPSQGDPRSEQEIRDPKSFKLSQPEPIMRVRLSTANKDRRASSRSEVCMFFAARYRGIPLEIARFRGIPVDDTIVGGASEKILKPPASSQNPSLLSFLLHLPFFSSILRNWLPHNNSTEVDRLPWASGPNASGQ